MPKEKPDPLAALPSRFRAMAHIADTEMSTVSLAVETLAPGITRLVVVKSLLPHLHRDGERRTMFLDEARILAHLNHPHVVSLIAAGENNVGSFLVLEYVPGHSLHAWIDRSRNAGRAFPRAVSMRLLLDVADALAYVHAARDAIGRPLKVVHRDLKPANVLVGQHGGIKLIDFGIAAAEARLHETVTGVLKGTEGYMAPEQRVAGAAIDHRVDVYAFGVLCYELLAAIHPFGSERLPTSKLVPLDKRCDVPARIGEIVGACLEHDPANRPATMQRVAIDLRQAAGPVAAASEVVDALRALGTR